MAVAVVAIACAVLFGLNDNFAYLATSYLSLLLASILTGLFVYGGATCRSFAVGAFPILVFWITFFPLSEGLVFGGSIRLSTSISMLLVAIGGTSTMIISRISSAADISAKRLSNRRSILTELLVGLILGLLLGGTTGVSNAAFETFQKQEPPTQRRGGVL